MTRTTVTKIRRQKLYYIFIKNILIKEEKTKILGIEQRSMRKPACTSTTRLHYTLEKIFLVQLHIAFFF